MMPYSLVQIPGRGKAWFTHSNQQPNKRAASQWVLQRPFPTFMDSDTKRGVAGLSESIEALQVDAILLEQSRASKRRS